MDIQYFITTTTRNNTSQPVPREPLAAKTSNSLRNRREKMGGNKEDPLSLPKLGTGHYNMTPDSVGVRPAGRTAVTIVNYTFDSSLVP